MTLKSECVASEIFGKLAREEVNPDTAKQLLGIASCIERLEAYGLVSVNDDNAAHLANGPIEMPGDLFMQAVKLAEDIPFETTSAFALSVAHVPGGLERHPAMKLLCDWWDQARPTDEPLKPGSAMPLVRGGANYISGYYEDPDEPVTEFNPTGRNAARIGDIIIVLFRATQESAVFEKDGMRIMLPSGAKHWQIGVDRESYLSGEYDDAWYCLEALRDFRMRFPAAWRALKSGERPRGLR